MAFDKENNEDIAFLVIVIFKEDPLSTLLLVSGVSSVCVQITQECLQFDFSEERG